MHNEGVAQMTQAKRITIFYVFPVIACFLLFLLEQVLRVDYLTKTIAKLILFLGIPFIGRCLYQPANVPKNRKNELTAQLLPGIAIGLFVIGTVAAVYLLVRGRIDTVGILAELKEKSGITKQTYLYTGLYITFVNSFLEEFFFRKYIFGNLYQDGMKRFAYIGSALLFSVYHLAIFNTWFKPFLLILALLGLLAAGLILSYVVRKTNSLLSSWVIHLSADIAIIGIGYTWFV